jgi:N4-gp56 family major capsid protein
VYPVLILARDAFGVVRLQGKEAVQVMVLNAGTPRGGDELAQRGSVGWKTYYAAVRLNEAWMARLECGVRAQPV